MGRTSGTTGRTPCKAQVSTSACNQCIIITGMEAIWRVEVEDFPAFIVVDDKGNDFFKEWQTE